jgi:hypothetical protein
MEGGERRASGGRYPGHAGEGARRLHPDMGVFAQRLEKVHSNSGAINILPLPSILAVVYESANTMFYMRYANSCENGRF